MTTAKSAALTQAPEAATEQPSTGPTMIDASLFKLVSGGSPKGGWELDPIVIEQGTPATPVGSP